MKPIAKRRSLTCVAAAVVVAALFAGCTVGPHYRPPAPPTVGSYIPAPQPSETVSSAGNAGAAQHLNPAMDVPAQWWTLFHSPELDRLVREMAATPAPRFPVASAVLVGLFTVLIFSVILFVNRLRSLLRL